MTKYRLTPAAKEDLKGVWHYSAETWGTKKAQQYCENIEQAIQNLTDFPKKGRLRNEIRKWYRSIKTGKHIIFYCYNNHCLDIARILHERMDSDPL